MLLNDISDSRHLIDDGGFRRALYAFDIGQNDLSDAFSDNLSYMQVIERIPSILGEIRDAVKVSNYFLHGCLIFFTIGSV